MLEACVTLCGGNHILSSSYSSGLDTPLRRLGHVLQGFIGRRIRDGGIFHYFIFFSSKSLDPAWDPSHLRAWLCHMTYEVAKARGAATGKSHAESQPALGGCPELLTGEFPFCCTANALGGGRGEGVGAGLCTTGHVGPFFDPSIWIRACLSRL